MLTEFATIILYGQLALANPAGPGPAVVWTDDDVAQGFAWDTDAVAFGIPDHDGECLVSVETSAPAPAGVADDALWAIAVPFTATGPVVTVGTVMLERPVPIVPGRYQVVFQARPGTPPGTFPDTSPGTLPGGQPAYAYRLHVSFTPADAPGYAILRQGSLGSGQVLHRQARRG